MIIKGENISLRPWDRSDINSLVAHANNIRVWRNLRDPFPHPYTQSDAESWINLTKTDEKFAHSFAITSEDESIGAAGLIPVKQKASPSFELGYWIGEPFWGQGYATEAVSLLSRYAFTKLNAPEITAYVYKWNIASGRVLEKNGFKLNDDTKIVVYKDGEEVEQFIYTKSQASDKQHHLQAEYSVAL